MVKNGDDQLLALFLGIDEELGVILRLDEINFVVHEFGLLFKLFSSLVELFFDDRFDVVDFFEKEERLFHEFWVGGGAYFEDEFVEVPVARLAVKVSDFIIDDLWSEYVLWLFKELGNAHVDL